MTKCKTSQVVKPVSKKKFEENKLTVRIEMLNDYSRQHGSTFCKVQCLLNQSKTLVSVSPHKLPCSILEMDMVDSFNLTVSITSMSTGSFAYTYSSN